MKQQNYSFANTLSPILLPIMLILGMFFSCVANAKPDTTETSGFALLPFASYAPETKLAGGIAANYYFRFDTSTIQRPSIITAGLLLTQMQQYGIGLYPDIYIWNERGRITALCEYFRYPDSFFGIGAFADNNDRERYLGVGFKMNAAFYVNSQWQSVRDGINLGLRFEARSETISNIEKKIDGTEGLLSTGEITGSRGGTTIGIGVAANYDTRDNVFAPYSGWYCQSWMMVYDKKTAGNFSFVSYVADARTYIQLDEDIVLALQGFFQTINGNPGFYSLARFGGSNIMRGFFDGRFRDKTASVAQYEVRFPVLGKFGGAAFSGIGQVASTIGKLSFDNIKISYGVGLRYMLVPEERLTIRADMGVGNGDIQMYVGIFEAF